MRLYQASIWIALVLLLTVVAGLYVGISLRNMRPEPVVLCHTFHVASPNPVGMVYIGQIELCGQNMEWSTIWGPIGAEKPEPRLKPKPTESPGVWR